MSIHAHSRRPLDTITVEAIRSGDLVLDDVRISRETLLHQAQLAEQSGSNQLAINLRRAGELTSLDTEEILAIYEALRPHRSSAAELAAIAESLDARDAPTCAALVREAAEVYRRRDLDR